MAVADKNEERCCLCTALGSAWAFLVRGWRAYGAWWERLEREADDRWAAQAGDMKITIMRSSDDDDEFVPLTPQELLTAPTCFPCCEFPGRYGLEVFLLSPFATPSPLQHSSYHTAKRVRQAIALARRDGLL